MSEPAGEPRQVPPWWTDPTRNVESLVRAAMARQDDLREMQARYVAQIGEMREAHAGEMRETARMYEGRLDAKDQQIRGAETARIDAIRLVDVGAVQRAAEVQANQAQALAAQATTLAETLRAQVQSTADAWEARLRAGLEPIFKDIADIIKDIADLRRAQYETQGQKTQVVETRAGASSQYALIGVMLAAVAIIVTILLATGH